MTSGTDPRAQLLTDSLLAPLPGGELQRLADLGHDTWFRAGASVLVQGEWGDELFLVMGGTALVLGGTADPIEIATVGVGGVFGELSVLTLTKPRTAAVTALTDLRCVVIPGSAVRDAMDRHPEAGVAISAAAQTLAAASFLRNVAAFAPLDDDARRSLAAKVTRITFEAGSPILTAGDPSDSCFVLLSGEVEVRAPGSDPIRVGAGALFGELGVLTGEPRSASVVTVKPSTVLRLTREDLLAGMGGDPAVEAAVFELLRLRGRPKRKDGIEAHQRETPTAEPYTILEDPGRGVYFRLSALGWFVWERLDGTRNVRDLALAYFSERGGFAPDGIARLIAALGRSGFLDPATTWIPNESPSQGGSLAGLAGRARAILTWHADIRNVDDSLTRLYGAGIRHLYGRAGQVMLGILAISGVVATIALAANGLDGPIGASWWFLVPGLFVSLMIHEAGHAFTAKAFGYEVRQAGVGWFWIGPMAFVDTSDVWLATRKQRLLVALAGPYATILFAGTCAIVGLVWSAAAPACLVLALSSYISVFTNLNPLIELDGYYALVHLTDRPNLRSKALGWLGTEGPSALRHPSRLRGHGLDAAYALASIGYLIVVGVLIVLVYRAVLEGWVADVASPTFAAVIAWIAAGAVCTLLTLGVIGDIIHARERARAR